MAGLTEQQKKALDLDRHISVTANAGSGKTRVLTERYLEAVKNGVDVEQILCLTFTEKAALELREKIQAGINSEIAAERKLKWNDGHLRALKDARGKMLDAYISTIHSFCSQVLREFPVEAGIDANFKVLEDFDSATLKEESCDRAIRDALAEERASHGGAHSLLVRLGYRKTLSLLVDLLDSREKVEHIKVRGHKLLMEEGTVREHWRSLAEAAVRIARENVRPRKSSFAAEIKEVEDSLKSNRDCLPPLAGLIRRILTNEGTPRKREVDIVSPDSWVTAHAILRTIQESLADLHSDRKTVAGYFFLLQTVIGLFEKSVEHYDRKKYSMSALDFDDLQIKTMHLLSENENVRSTLASRFKHIMVDEFQDTNFLQYDIFLNLIGNFSGGARLFVVGDPKQSIYRFRNAQVEVSVQTEKEISGLKDGIAIPLLESFRMNADLSSFVNEVFSKGMSQGRPLHMAGLPSPVQTEYKPLIAQRPKGVEPSIEIFLTKVSIQAETSDEDQGEESSSGLSSNEQQALFVAARIKEMGDQNELVKDVKLGEEARKIKCGDIAILLRSRTRLDVLEQSLSEKGVPYSVTSGIGFYSAQEIFDLTNYLTFLLDNNADISLLTVVRSPLFGISEDDLFKASLCEGETLFERLKALAGSANAPDQVKYAVSVLNDEIQLAHRFTIPQLVNRILERTGWLSAYKLSVTGEQRMANMRKLLSIAREFEGRGFNNLYDFVERLKYLKDTAREGQAVVEETADVVKIMTIHAAKGLEFPVVIVPFCDSMTNRRRNLVVNDQVGVLPFISNEVPQELSLYQSYEKQNEQAEITRLFYVACTRAMDRLILTTAPKKPKAQDAISFADIISASFDISSPPESGCYEYAGGKVRVITEIPVVKSEPGAGKWMLEPGNKTGDTSSVRIFLDPIPADIDGEIYSATLLQTFKLCPTKYFLRYRLGMPAPEGGRKSEAGSVLDEYDDSILSTVKGEIIHAVLHDLLSKGIHDDTGIVETAEHAIAGRLGNSLRGEEVLSLRNQVVENSKNAITTLRDVSKPGKLHLEETITRRFGKDFLTGTLDLFTEDENGFHIYDYKTNRLDKGLDRICSDYEIQMRFYASLCGRLNTEQDSFDVTIVFTREPGKYRTKTYSREEIEDFEKDLESMIREIKAIGLPSGSYPSTGEGGLPTFTPHCGECEYFVGDKEKMCLLKVR